MGKFDYEFASDVKAAQWRGDNLDEIRELLKGVVEDDPDGYPAVYAEYIEPYFLTSLGNRGGYYMLITEFDEFDPGIWIVVHADGEVEGMEDEQFTKLARKKA